MNLNEEDFDFESKIQQSLRRSHEESAVKLMEEARSMMIAVGLRKPDHAFMSHLVLSLKYAPSWLLPTAATDGEWVYYNPEYIIRLKKEELRSVHYRLVLFCVLEHHLRRRFRDPEKWGIAATLVVNQMLKDLGYHLPPQAILPGEGMYKKIPKEGSVEEVYRSIPDGDAKKQSQFAKSKGFGAGRKDGQGFDPDGLGGIMDHEQGESSEASKAMNQEHWKRNVSQADAMARQRGTMSANLKTLIDNLLETKVNWREVLRDFINKRVKRDYDWNRPNRRYLAGGVYFPAKGGETIGRVLIANDTSGSMDYLNARSVCATEIQGIAEQIGCNLTILHHDAEVCNVQEWSPDVGILKLEPRGGGGTSHVPVFQWVDKHGDEGDDEIACIICLTDLYTEFPKSHPDLPVLWAVVGNPTGKAPFGQTLHVKDD